MAFNNCRGLTRVGLSESDSTSFAPSATKALSFSRFGQSPDGDHWQMKEPEFVFPLLSCPSALGLALFHRKRTKEISFP